MERKNQLKVLAISAPHWPKKADNSHEENHLNSRTPFSLQNAIRHAAGIAAAGIGEWATSNWADACELSDSIYMSDYLCETLKWLDSKVDDVNIVFLGAMSISMRGAIEVATYIKRRNGNAFIVLGGKHALETSYLGDEKYPVILKSSPINLMQKKLIPRIFDLVISGDGEEIVSAIGTVCSKMKRDCISPSQYMDYIFNENEPPRVLRRLQHLREWSHEQVEQVFT